MAETPEELALDLSRASLAAQEQSEVQLREQPILEDAARRVSRSIKLLTAEILALVAGLAVTLVS